MSAANGNGNGGDVAEHLPEKPELTLVRPTVPASLEVIQSLCETTAVKLAVLEKSEERWDEVAEAQRKLVGLVTTMSEATARIENMTHTTANQVLVLTARLSPIGRLTFALLVLLGAACGGSFVAVSALVLRKLLAP